MYVRVRVVTIHACLTLRPKRTGHARSPGATTVEQSTCIVLSIQHSARTRQVLVSYIHALPHKGAIQRFCRESFDITITYNNAVAKQKHDGCLNGTTQTEAPTVVTAI